MDAPALTYRHPVDPDVSLDTLCREAAGTMAALGYPQADIRDETDRIRDAHARRDARMRAVVGAALDTGARVTTLDVVRALHADGWHLPRGWSPARALRRLGYHVDGATCWPTVTRGDGA